IHTATYTAMDAQPVLNSDEDGELVNTVDFLPTRETVKKYNHVGARVAVLMGRPELKLRFNSEIYKRADSKGLLHPGSAMEPTDIDNLTSDFVFDFYSEAGDRYFIVEENTVKGRQGDLYETDYTLDLV